MDEAELKDLIPPKEENPLLKRKPLNLGTHFLLFSNPEQPLQIETILLKPHLTLLCFAAEWCNVSKSFLPSLKQFYQEVNLEQKKIEIIYVGFDKVKKDFETITKQMPWLGLGFADERVSGLKQFYDIRAIPKLVLLDSRGQQVSVDCREDVYNIEPDAAYDKWQQLKLRQDKSYYQSFQ